MAHPSNLHTLGSRTDDVEAVDTEHLDDVMDAVFQDTEAVYYPDSGDNSETDLLHGYDTEVVPDSDDELTDSNENKGYYRRSASLFERIPAELHKVVSHSHPLCKSLDKSNTDIDACVDERRASCLATDINGGNGATPIIVHCDMQATNLHMQDKKMPMIKDPCQTDSCDVSCSEDVKRMCMESKVENNGKLSQSNSREVRLVYTRKTNRLLNLEDKTTEDVKKLIDDSNDYGGLSYVESQEPEDVSSALLFVDQYLCVNAMQLPSSPLSVVKTKQTSPPALSAKGTQSLVRWTGVRNSEKKAGIFEWNDSLDGDGGCISSDNRDHRQLAFRGRKYNQTYVRRSPSVKNSFLAEQGHKNDRGDSEGNLDQQAVEASILKKTEISAIPEDSELDYDIGIGTQIAVEAIQALSSAVSVDCSEIDVNQCPQSLPDMPSEATQNQMHAGVWSFPKKARSEYTETPDSNFSSKENCFDHPVEKMQASKQVPRKDGGKLTAAKCVVGRSSADTDKVKLTKRSKAYRAKKASKDGCKENLDRSLSNEDKPLYKLKNRRRVKNSNRATTNSKSSSLFNMQEGLVSEPLRKTVADLKSGSLDKEINRGITDMLDFSAENVNSSKNFSDTSLNTRNMKLNDEVRKSFVVHDPSTDVLVSKKRDQMDCLHNIGKEGSKGSNEISAWSTNWGLRDYPRGKRTCRSLLDRSEGYSDLVNLSVKIRQEKPNLYPLRSQMNAETQSFSSGFKRKRRSTIYISPCLWSSKKYEQCFLRPPISELKKNGSLYDNDYNAKKDEAPSEQLTKNTIAEDVTSCKANENTISDDVAFTSCQTSPSQMNSMNLVDGCSKQHGKIKPSPTALTRELSRLGFRESMPEFTPKTSRRRKTMANIRVLFSQNLDESTRKHQMKILMRFGVPIATSPSNATHFVTDRFARTRNMMEIIAQGKPVVTHQWLESCDQAGFYIDERDYIVRDAKKEQEFGFRLPISLDRAKQRPILKGYRVFITPHAKPGKEMLAGLVKAVHGKVLNVVKDNDLDNLLILSCDEDHAHCIPFLQKGAEAYDPELLLNGIIMQKLEFARHRLFSA